MTFNYEPGAHTSFIYAVPTNGLLQWYRHDGAGHGTKVWHGARTIGKGWSGLTVISGCGSFIYAITPEGEMLWYEHVGFGGGGGLSDPGSWKGRTTVNYGFNQYSRIFSGGNGIIYGITADGKLMWHRHHLIKSGEPVEYPDAWSGPKEVGIGWNSLVKVFGGGDGIIYGVNTNGDLLWYNHLGRRQGLGLNDAGAWLGAKRVGIGWGSFTTLFSSGSGVIYGIQPDGVLRWYRHLGYENGAGLNTPRSWEGGIDVGIGWGSFTTVFALLPCDPPPLK